jgi:hypothetical protein
MSTKLTYEVAAQGNPNFLAARENPLRFNRVSKLGYRFAHHDWPCQLARLEALRYRAAIVGHQGSGKTTLLYELADQLNRANIANHHVFLPQATTDHPTMIQQAMTCSQNEAVLLVDGIERLSFIQRRQLLKRTKRGPGLVVAVHQACNLPTWVHCRTNPELMKSVLTDLGLEDPAVQDAGLRAFENSDGNIREALRELYDQFSTGRFNDILS